MGAVEPGVIALTVGTSGVVFATTPSALIEPEGRLHAFCHAVPGMWHFMGVMLSAAGSLQWYRDTLAPGMPFDDLLHEAAAIPAGSEGLLFLPYLTGERTPHPDPLARGAFVGLTLRHGRGHLTRAVLEGVAFGLKDSFALIQAGRAGRDPPGARLRRRGEKPALAADPGGCAGRGAGHGQHDRGRGLRRGAAGRGGRGAWPDVPSACRAAITITGSTARIPAQVEIYRQRYPAYCELYPALKPTFDRVPAG